MSLLLILTLVHICLAQVPSRTPWEYIRGPIPIPNPAWNFTRNACSLPACTHGLIQYYSAAVVPTENDPRWKHCSTNDTWCRSSDNVDVASSSRLTTGCAGGSRCPCIAWLDFAYFQTFVNIAPLATVTEFKITFSNMDDGSRVSVYNQLYPNGLVIGSSYVYLSGKGTSDLKSYLYRGRNGIVVTQVDDCPVHNNIKAQVQINGDFVPPSCALAQCQTGIWSTTLQDCIYTPIADGSNCTDNDVCTQTDKCRAGVCVGTNSQVCTPNPCQTPVCDRYFGCTYSQKPLGNNFPVSGSAAFTAGILYTLPRTSGAVSSTLTYNWTANPPSMAISGASFTQVSVYNTQRGEDITSPNRYNNQVMYSLGSSCASGSCEQSLINCTMPQLFVGDRYVFQANNQKIGDRTCSSFIPVPCYQDLNPCISVLYMETSSPTSKLCGALFLDGSYFTVNTLDTKSPVTPPSSLVPAAGCTCSRQIDVAIAIDRSSSMNQTTLELVKLFLRTFVTRFTFGVNNTRVAISEFRAGATEIIGLSGGSSLSAVINGINTIGCDTAGNPSLCCTRDSCVRSVSSGIQRAAEQLNLGRADASKVIIVISGGNNNMTTSGVGCYSSCQSSPTPTCFGDKDLNTIPDLWQSPSNTGSNNMATCQLDLINSRVYAQMLLSQTSGELPTILSLNLNGYFTDLEIASNQRFAEPLSKLPGLSSCTGDQFKKSCLPSTFRPCGGTANAACLAADRVNPGLVLSSASSDLGRLVNDLSSKTCASKNTCGSQDISLDFTAAAPFSYDPELGGGAYNLRTVGTDVTQSLNSDEFSCGDRVTFLTRIAVARAASAPSQNVELCFDYSADASGQSGVAFTQVLTTRINYGLVQNGGNNQTGYDLGILDDGASKILDSYSWYVGTPFTKGALLKSCVLVSDLEPSEKVVLRQDVFVECKPYTTATGGLTASLTSATRAVPGTTINASVGTGAQTVTLKLPQGVGTPYTRTAISTLCPDETCNDYTDFTPTTSNAFTNQPVRYCIRVRNSGTLPLLNAKITYDSGTPFNPSDDVLPPLGPAFALVGGQPGLPPGVTSFTVLEVPGILFPATAKFTVTTTGAAASGTPSRSSDALTLTFSDMPHLFFVRHEVTENLRSLLPQLKTMSRSENFVLPYWRTSWAGGTTNTLLVGTVPDKIDGQTEKEFLVSTTERTYTFVVRHYSKSIQIQGATRKTSFYLIDYSHPFDSPSDQALYEEAWRLSIVPLCNLEAELNRARTRFTPDQFPLLRHLIPILQLGFDATAAQLLDSVVSETTLVDHLGKTSALPLFANTVYGALTLTRKWQMILTLEDYVYFREALSPDTLALFRIPTGGLTLFTSDSGYFLVEAYAVHYSSFITVPSFSIRDIIAEDSSAHVPFPFYGILRRELYQALLQQRLRVIFPGVEPLRWSLPARDSGTQPLTALPDLKAAARAAFRAKYPNSYCTGNPTHWAAWVTNQVDAYEGSKEITRYADLLLRSGVCLVLVAGTPCSPSFEADLGDYAETHTMVWLPEHDSDDARLAILASDFGFLPDAESGWPLVAIEHLMHGNRLVSPGSGGIRDVAVFRGDKVPSVAGFDDALALLSPNSTSTLDGWLAATNLCSRVWSALPPNTYTFTVTRDKHLYTLPDEASLARALTLAKADKSALQGVEAQYLRALVLQGHCYKWACNSLSSLKEYRSMVGQLSAVSELQDSRQLPPTPPFNVNQRAQFVRASQTIVTCPPGALVSSVPTKEGLEYSTFKSEYVSKGSTRVLVLPGIPADLFARYAVANVVDKDHFPDLQCVLPDTTSATVLLNVDDRDGGYKPLSPAVVGTLSSKQQQALTQEVFKALSSLSDNNMCHGALLESRILVSVGPGANLRVKLIGLAMPAVGDLTEEECMAADVVAWSGIKTRLKL